MIATDPSTDPPRYYEDTKIPQDCPPEYLEAHVQLFDWLVYLWTEYREEIKQLKDK